MSATAMLPGLRRAAEVAGWEPIVLDGPVIGWSAGVLTPVIRQPSGQWCAASPVDGVYRPVASEAHALIATVGKQRWAVRRGP